MKKIQQNIIFILLICSAAANAYLYRININLGSNMTAIRHQYIRDVQIAIDDQSICFEKDSMQLYSENRQISKEILLKTLDGSKLQIEDVFLTPKIVIYWDQYNCSACYQSHFMDINGIMRQLGKENFAFVGNFESLRELDVFVRTEGIKCNAYLCKDKLDIPIENSDMPFVFYMNKSLRIENVFSLDKNYHQRNTRYLNYIADFYLNKEPDS